MTMWLSAKKVRKGKFRLNHIQRGFPIKEVYKINKNRVDFLRSLINKTIISPRVKNIYYEIFTKSINSFAFNLIAILYNQNNYMLNKNMDAKRKILIILNEADKILKKLNIKIYQSSNSRIKQTLSSSAHTMSMLSDYKNKKKLEIHEIWKSLKILSKLMNFKMEETQKIYLELKE